MGSRTKFIAVLATLVSASLLWFGTGLHPIWWMAWLWPLPLLLLLGDLTGPWLPRLVFAAAATGNANIWDYLRNHVGLPVFLCVLATLGPALIWAGAVWGFQGRVRRGASWAALVFLPVALTAWQFGLNLDPINGTASDRTYSQMDFLPVVQLASVAGLSTITFIVTLFPAAISLLLVDLRRGKKPWAGGAGLVLIVSALSWGQLRLFDPLQTRYLAAGLVSIDTDSAAKPEYLQAYRPRFAALEARGANVVLGPEKVSHLDQGTTKLLQNLRLSRATVAIGVLAEEGDSLSNELVLLHPFQPDLIYRKRHMVPGFESDETPGESPMTSGKAGLAICKDLDFPADHREYGRLGVDYLLVPAWDFEVDGWLHSRMAILRGVESGFSVLRSARNGHLTVSDACGRVIGETHSGQQDLLVKAPIGHVDTLYAKFGDWLGFGSLILYIGILLAPIPKPRRQSSDNR